MRLSTVCGFELVVPEAVAAWDAVAGDSPWEYERIHSILGTLRRHDVLYDIGAEHGWMSAIYGQHVGGGHMVLVEPSPEFWPNIRQCWAGNNLRRPAACFQGFAGKKVTGGDLWVGGTWPPAAHGSECAAMAYRSPLHHEVREDHPGGIHTITIDQISRSTGRPPYGITIDVEGAEYDVLQGALETLVTWRPWVWVSIHPDLMERDFDATPADLTRFMRDIGYKAKHLRTDHEEHWAFWPFGDKPEPSDGHP